MVLNEPPNLALRANPTVELGRRSQGASSYASGFYAEGRK